MAARDEAGPSVVAKPYRIVVVDDHTVVRRGIVESLGEDADFLVVGEGGSADDAIALAASAKPDVCLLDVTMPGGGIEACRRISADFPSIVTLMFSFHEDAVTKQDALAAGAAGYVVKGVAGSELKATIRALVEKA